MDSVRDSHNLEGLANAVQSRLWLMMRKKLFHTSAMYSLFRGSNTSSGEIFDSRVHEDEDLLGPYSASEMDSPGITGTNSNTAKEEKDDGEVSDFNDLLGGDDFLGFFDGVERERIKTEQETEEMLFGDAWVHDSDADMLLDPVVEDDSMLIND